ncbi:Glutamate-1-semialdehyde 2,1-aminomutase [Geodia barretti]|nr:Glutamate-1-semialdehyde 2,1-aminomutase [Geodia barretti]
MGSAALLLGHAHPEVVSALSAVLADGSHFGAPTEPMLEWGERVCTLMPCADKVRFVGSGAEATMLAMRVARGYTGKEKIIRWESHYHGWHDYVMPGNLPPFDVPASIGIPQGTIDSIIVLPTDLTALENVLANDDNIAGVITEASGASYGTVPLPDGFLEGVRRLTRETRRGDDHGRGYHRFPVGARWRSGAPGCRTRPLYDGQNSYWGPTRRSRCRP